MIRTIAIASAHTMARPRISLHTDVISAQVARPLLLFVLAGGLASLLYIAQTSGVATTGYDLQSLEGQRQLWLARNEQARARVAVLESLDRVETEAMTRLQMVAPKGIIFVAVAGPTGVSSTPAPPPDRSINGVPAHSGVETAGAKTDRASGAP